MMKKTLLLALAILASAAFCQAMTGKKDKKKKKETAAVVAEPVVLASVSDSISYAMGMEATNGLIPYLVDQMGIDTAYMAKFIEGFENAIDKERNTKEVIAYGAGINIANMVTNSMVKQASRNLGGVVDSITPNMFVEGFLSALKQQHDHFNDSTAAAFIADKRDEHVKRNKRVGEEFLVANTANDGVVTLPSGLQYKVLREGNGPIASKDDEVEVKYEGRLIDGTVFDSSYTRNPNTTKFKPTQVIKGWTEALTLMPEGSMWELYIPQNLAYGERPAGKIPPYSTLIFKVELEKVIKAEPADNNAEAGKTVTAKPAAKTAAKPAPKGKTTAKGK